VDGEKVLAISPTAVVFPGPKPSTAWILRWSAEHLQTIRVGSAQYPTLDDALRWAFDGASIELGDGQFALARNMPCASFSIKGAGAGKTTIETDRTIEIGRRSSPRTSECSGAEVLMEDLTLLNRNGDGTALNVEMGSKLTLSNLTITGSATGVSVGRESTLDVKNCLLTDLEVAIAVPGHEAEVYVAESTLVDNETAVAANAGSVVLEDCLIEASLVGVRVANLASVTIDSSRFTLNREAIQLHGEQATLLGAANVMDSNLCPCYGLPTGFLTSELTNELVVGSDQQSACFSDLDDAISFAKPGSAIRMMDGEYQIGDIEISKELSIRGTAERGAILRGSILVANAHLTLRDIVLEGTDRDLPALDVKEAGRVSIDGCLLSNSRGAALELDSQCEARIEDSSILDSMIGIVSADQSYLMVDRSKITDTQVALTLGDGAIAELDNTAISRNDIVCTSLDADHPYELGAATRIDGTGNSVCANGSSGAIDLGALDSGISDCVGDAEIGDFIWRVSGPGRIRESIVLGIDGSLVFTQEWKSYTSYTVCNLGTAGETVWTANLDYWRKQGPPICTMPVDDDWAVFTASAARVYSMASTGWARWDFTEIAEPYEDQILDMALDPTRGRILFTEGREHGRGFDGIGCLDSDGDPMWGSSTAGAPSSNIVLDDAGTSYVGTVERVAQALDTAGAELWLSSDLGASPCSLSLAWENSLLVCTESGEISKLSTGTGEQEWKLKLRMGELSQATVSTDSQAHVMGEAGILYTFSDSGSLLWEVDLAAMTDSTDRDIYTFAPIASSGGELYACYGKSIFVVSSSGAILRQFDTPDGKSITASPILDQRGLLWLSTADRRQDGSVFAVYIGAASPAPTSWPMEDHDPQRTSCSGCDIPLD